MFDELQLGDRMPAAHAVIADAWIEGNALLVRQVFHRTVPDMAKLIKLARAACRESFGSFPRGITLCELTREFLADDLWKGYHIFIKGEQTGLFMYVRVVPQTMLQSASARVRFTQGGVPIALVSKADDQESR